MGSLKVNLFRFLGCVLIASAPISPGAELKLGPDTDHFLFGGQPGAVRVFIENRGDSAVVQKVGYRFYQASSSTLAPVAEQRLLGERRFPPGEMATATVPFTPPEVRAPTLFVAKLHAGESELGSVNVHVIPPRILSRLKDLGPDSIRLHEPDPVLETLFKECGVTTTDDLREDSKILMVRLPDAAAESGWRENETGSTLPTLFILGRGVSGAEKVLPVKRVERQGRPVVVVQDWFVTDLKESARSQLRLLRAIQLLHAPQAEALPLNGKKAN